MRACKDYVWPNKQWNTCRSENFLFFFFFFKMPHSLVVFFRWFWRRWYCNDFHSFISFSAFDVRLIVKIFILSAYNIVQLGLVLMWFTYIPCGTESNVEWWGIFQERNSKWIFFFSLFPHSIDKSLRVNIYWDCVNAKYFCARPWFGNGKNYLFFFFFVESPWYNTNVKWRVRNFTEFQSWIIIDVR